MSGQADGDRGVDRADGDRDVAPVEDERGVDHGDGDGGADQGEADAWDGGELTLAIDLAAFEALLDPRAVFADARRWSRYVGVVADDADAVESAVRDHGVRQDFEIGRLDRRSVLSKLKWEAGTDRYVFVGTDEVDRALAEHVGWEYLPVEEAAAEAGWTLAADAGALERLRTSLSRVAPWLSRGP